MPVPDTYMATTARIAEMLATIRRVEVPDRLSNELLRRLGFTSSNDRPFIRMLKVFRFLDDSGVPTQRYRDYRHPATGDAVLAEAMREAYADVFFQHPDAPILGASDLTAIFQRESGKSERVAREMAATFRAFADQADWTSDGGLAGAPTDGQAPESDAEAAAPEPNRAVSEGPNGVGGSVAALSLRHDVHVHLPETTDPAVYDAIFRSLREHLL